MIAKELCNYVLVKKKRKEKKPPHLCVRLFQQWHPPWGDSEDWRWPNPCSQGGTSAKSIKRNNTDIQFIVLGVT